MAHWSYDSKREREIDELHHPYRDKLVNVRSLQHVCQKKESADTRGGSQHVVRAFTRFPAWKVLMAGGGE
jgi:hypothetical protein